MVALNLVAELQEPQTSASGFVVAELLAFLSSSDEFRYVGFLSFHYVSAALLISERCASVRVENYGPHRISK